MIHVATSKWAWLKKGVVGLAAAVLMASALPVHKAGAAPTEGDVLAHATVPTASDRVSNKYATIAMFNPGVSKMTMTGATTKTTNLGGKVIVDPTTSQKGKIVVTYTRVATYQGRELDLEMKVVDWKGAGFTDGLWMRFHTGSIGLTQGGYEYIDIESTYRYHDTGEIATDMTGSYMTVNDFDSNQFMSFDSAMMGKIDKMYAYTPDTRVSYWTTGAYTNIGARYWDAIESDDEKGIVTFLVSGHEFDFRWNKDYSRPSASNKPYNLNQDVDYMNEESAQFFGYIAKKPARTEMAEPAKTIVKADGTRTKSNTVNAGSSFTYGIHHTIPDEYAKFYYSSYRLRDTVPSGVDVTDVTVMNASDKDVTNLFTVSTSGRNVTATAKSGTLSDPDFYGQTYSVLIKVKVKDWQDLETMANGNHTFNISNTGYAKVDSNELPTNPVTTRIVMPWDVTVKHVHKKSGKLLDTETVKRFDGEGYNFSPKTDLKNVDGYSYIPTDDKDVSGTVNGGDVTVTIYYDLPIGDYGIKRVEVYTKPNDDATGLRTNVVLDPKWIEALSANERDAALTGKKITLTITDITKGEVALAKEFTLSSLTDETISTAIPVKKAGITPYNDGEKRMYSYKLSSSDPYIVTRNMKIDLNGFTSSRERIYDDQETVVYKGPVMVERDLGKVQKINLETVTMNAPKPKPVKTGYGVPLKIDVDYINDIATIPHGNYAVALYVDPTLIDSYLNYSKTNVNVTATQVDNMTRMTMANTTTKVGDGNTQASVMPKTMMESPTGYLFTESQVAANDSRITGAIKDAGRKLYVPTWLDTLKSYPYVFRTADNAIGANQVSFTLRNVVDIEAYMYSHTDSSTQDKDELLLLPKTEQDAAEAADPWFKQF